MQCPNCGATMIFFISTVTGVNRSYLRGSSGVRCIYCRYEESEMYEKGSNGDVESKTFILNT